MRRGGLALLGVAVGLALLASVLTVTRPTALLTRGELDKAVRGCKWWYRPIPSCHPQHLTSWVVRTPTLAVPKGRGSASLKS